MFIRNLIRYRRMMIILIGLILINVITRFMIDINAHDNFSLISFLLVNIIWIDFVRVRSEDYIQMIDRWIREESDY
jgi:hypothetical protein